MFGYQRRYNFIDSHFCVDKDDLYKPRIRAWKGRKLYLLPFCSWKTEAYFSLLQIIAYCLVGSYNGSAHVTA